MGDQGSTTSPARRFGLRTSLMPRSLEPHPRERIWVLLKWETDAKRMLLTIARSTTRPRSRFVLHKPARRRWTNYSNLHDLPLLRKGFKSGLNPRPHVPRTLCSQMMLDILISIKLDLQM